MGRVTVNQLQVKHGTAESSNRGGTVSLSDEAAAAAASAANANTNATGSSKQHQQKQATILNYLMPLGKKNYLQHNIMY